MNRTLSLIALFSLSLNAAAGRTAERTSDADTRTEDRSSIPDTAERICAWDPVSEDACDGIDLFYAMDGGLLVVPNTDLAKGTYEDSTCQLTRGIYGQDANYVLVDDWLYDLEDTSSDDDLDDYHDYDEVWSCGNNQEDDDDGNSTLDACVDNCGDTYDECVSTIHGGGISPEEQAEICGDAQDECVDHCQETYGR